MSISYKGKKIYPMHEPFYALFLGKGFFESIFEICNPYL